MPVGRLAVLRVYSKHELLRVMSFVTIPGLVGPLIGPALGLAGGGSELALGVSHQPAGGVARLYRQLVLHAGSAPEHGQVRLAGIRDVQRWHGAGVGGPAGVGEHSISTGWALFALLFGLAAMASYWLYAANAEEPLFGLGLFKTSTFAIGIWGNLFARPGSGAMPFLTPLFLQLGLGFAEQGGMTMIPPCWGPC